MSRLTDLIAQARAKDPQLGADLDREYKALASRLPFGLNFERHRPEAVELPGRTVRRGDKVRVLPPRGSNEKRDLSLWRVVKIDKASKLATLMPLDDASRRVETRRDASRRVETRYSFCRTKNYLMQ